MIMNGYEKKKNVWEERVAAASLHNRLLILSKMFIDKLVIIT